MIEAKDDDLLTVNEVAISVPKKARIFLSLKCHECGDGFMEICGRTASGKFICKDCQDKLLN